MNPLPLYKFGIGFEDIRAALASANAHTPKGFVDQGGRRFTLETNDQARVAQAYRDLIIAWRNGRPVRLVDVAEVKDSVEDVRNAGYFNRKPAIVVQVFMQAEANIVQALDQINTMIPHLQATLPSAIDLQTVMDRSLTIRASLADTRLTLVLSVELVVLTVLLFLGTLRATLIPAIVIPVSIMSTLGVISVLGYSLDNMSLMALTVATGFVVDDAIVVMENINRHVEDGIDPFRAAILGFWRSGIHRPVHHAFTDRRLSANPPDERHRRAPVSRICNDCFGNPVGFPHIVSQPYANALCPDHARRYTDTTGLDHSVSGANP